HRHPDKLEGVVAGGASMSREAIGRPMEILLVEDSVMSARLTIGALSRSKINHRLTWTSDGSDAREFLFREGRYSRAPRPDLILLDLNLPEIDGRTLLKSIRATKELKTIPVVIMTGGVDERGIDEFRSLDAQGFLVKP